MMQKNEMMPQMMQTPTLLAMRCSIGVPPQMMQQNKMMLQIMPQMVPPQMMQSSWTPTAAMQKEASIGIPQMRQTNEMMPQMMMQNLKQEMVLRMEMILRRRSI